MSGIRSLDLTQSFLVAAEELNFRRAAERLAVDQSALSRRISRLEAELGFQLFERTTREVSLTPAGRNFYESTAHLLGQYDRSIEAARRTAEGKTGFLRIAYMAFAAIELMPRVVAAFRAANAHIDVNLRYMRTQGQKLALGNAEIDLGFMIGPFEHSEFHSRQLASDPLHVFLRRDHPLAEEAAVKPADLARQNLLLGDMDEWEAYRRRLGDMFASNGLRIAPQLEASSTTALLGLVAAGLGVTIYPRPLAGIAGTHIESRPIDDPAFRIETILVWRRMNRAASVRRFVECATRAAAPGDGAAGARTPARRQKHHASH